jgi:hypothetical protein
MKKMFHLTIAGLAWLAALATTPAGAWTYQNGDVLLIFRPGASGSNDVEFDIGSVSQFLNHPNGYTTTVTGWDPNLVVSNLSQVSNANVILAAATSASAWISSSSNVTSVSDVTASTFLGNLYDIINAIGSFPANDSEIAAESNAYVIAEFGDTSAGHSSLASYAYIVSGGGVNDAYIAQLGGNVPFDVQGVASSTLGFWQIQPTNASPKPAATYVGTFVINVNGTLTFTAGPVGPTIEGITRSGNVSTVSFTTLSIGNYSLVHTNALGAPVSTWPVVSGPVAGNGATKSLSHTDSIDKAGFYGVVRSP